MEISGLDLMMMNIHSEHNTEMPSRYKYRDDKKISIFN